MTEISKEYGTALFMLACEENEQKNYAQALQNIKKVFLENPQYVEMLASPGISLTDRLNSIDAVFFGVVPEHVISYMKLLCEKGRISCFLESVEAYKALFDASERISSAKITSAVELTEAEKKKLISKLELIEKSKINAEYIVEPSLMGGLIVEVDGRIMDGSLRRRLCEIKEVMNT